MESSLRVAQQQAQQLKPLQQQLAELQSASRSEAAAAARRDDAMQRSLTAAEQRAEAFGSECTQLHSDLATAQQQAGKADLLSKRNIAHMGAVDRLGAKLKTAEGNAA